MSRRMFNPSEKFTRLCFTSGHGVAWTCSPTAKGQEKKFSQPRDHLLHSPSLKGHARINDNSHVILAWNVRKHTENLHSFLLSPSYALPLNCSGKNGKSVSASLPPMGVQHLAQRREWDLANGQDLSVFYTLHNRSMEPSFVVGGGRLDERNNQ